MKIEFSNENYVSNFTPHIVDFIAEKQALGYKYESQPAVLQRFDQFCTERFPGEGKLSREVMLAWATRQPGEHPATLQGRVTPVRELAKYMTRQGLEAFILPQGMLPKVPRYVPHIYSNDELARIFAQTDRCHAVTEVPLRHLVMPVFFRLLYASGMRLSEARLLRCKDVDLTAGMITVTNAKLGKHRQLPVSPEMLTRLADYNMAVHAATEPKDWFFPGFGGGPMTRGNVEKNFRKFLWQAGISHGGRSKGPRVHDFRHTMAVHCLRRWVLAGKDLQAYLPVLQAYLGHVEFSDTAYYLHLTADLFPNITQQVEAAMGGIIPQAGEADETD